MYLSAANTSWPNTVLILGAVFAALILIAFIIAAYVEMRKTNLIAKQESDLRALVGRYEQLAGNILDAQQRTAADVSELRARAAAIEQILRTVE